ncbi:transporter, major facilitator family protein [Prevotella sp. DNF00663]|nr:transporter, major facilitator family protein [Prevotella sp. DNF00663]
MMILMAVLAGFTVANLYYSQPLLEMIRHDLHTTEVGANLITVITQVGYALGLLFVIPAADLYSRRRIIIVCMTGAALMAALTAIATDLHIIWMASLFLGLCSVVPQLFIPIAGQYSRPENKARNMGYVLSGLLTGILSARVLAGFIGDWLGWRAVYVIATCVMMLCCATTLRLMPRMRASFTGNYISLMRSVWTIVRTHPRIRLNSIRAAFGFGSMLAIWSCLAFHIAGAPFYDSSDMVGVLGLCGIAGAVAASGMGKWVPKYGVRKFSAVGAVLQIVAWMVVYVFRESYVGLIVGIILVDIGVQCQQLSNQSSCIQELPEASNRVNTIFMTTYFIGGSLGTFCAGQGWMAASWLGVCLVGVAFASASLLITSTIKQ